MIKKILIIVFATYALTINVIASDDGELILKKMIQQKLKIVPKISIEQLLNLTKH